MLTVEVESSHEERRMRSGVDEGGQRAENLLVTYHISWRPLGKRLLKEAPSSHPATGGEGCDPLQACGVPGSVRGG